MNPTSLFLVFLFLFISLSLRADTWVKTIVMRYDDSGVSGIRTPDGGFLVVSSTYWFGAVVQKLNSFGNLQWQKSYSSVYGNKMMPSEDGGFVLSGDVLGPNASASYPSLTKLNDQGDVIWHRVFLRDSFLSIAEKTKTGYILMYETWDLRIVLMNLDATGDILWEKMLGTGIVGVNLLVTRDSGYLVVGYVNDDGLVIKLNPEGKIEWKKVLGTPSQDSFGNVTLAKEGGFVLAGSTNVSIGKFCRNVDVWLVKMSERGMVEWQTVLGGPKCDSPYSIAAVPGGYLVSGIYGFEQTERTLESDLMLFKVDESGRLLWQRAYGKANHEEFASDLIKTGKEIAVLGGTTRYNSSGDFDTWILKLDANGNFSNGCADLTRESDLTVRAIRTTAVSRSISNQKSETPVTTPPLIPTHISSHQQYECSALTSPVPRLVERGGSLILKGQGFGKEKRDSEIHFGKNILEDILLWSDTQIRLNVPDSARTAPLRLKLPRSLTVPIELVVLPHRSESFWPTDGPPQGKTRVAIRRPYDMSNIKEVRFGSAPATNFRLATANVILCTTPPGSGVIDVQLSNGIQTRTLGKFKYTVARRTESAAIDLPEADP